ncbi:hypothetical protein [Jejuia spongiicola]|uniref:Phosphoribosyltransferase domain-containing protein n=1 Tax=Jejuia spongiicola TaxID=2942207 RepID=A0ABT0QD96_9FLAO|nr:hypothetical protein [Jejuia spongiicola]MCL6294603.1 hypothetical protein [Jejuia spongiicola]
MKVITLNAIDFFEKLDELSGKIDIVPDIVVEVLSAGGYLGKAIKVDKKFNKAQYKQIKIQRRREYIKQSIVFRTLLKILPYIILDRLRLYESKKAKNSISALNLDELQKDNISFGHLGFLHQKSVKNILIVDDAIDTGRTMFIIKNSLQKQFPKANIKTAIISWTLENSIIKPDFYIYKNVLVRFPWSKDYKGKDFEKKSFSS